MADMMMDTSKKYYDKDEYASKGVAGTALGLSIGALGLEVLKNGGLQNILGGITGNGTTAQQDSFSLYKGYRDADDAIIAKHNEDAFALYKGQRDNFDFLKAQVDAINTKLAVAETNIAWQNQNVMNAIALEKERRECADGKIVSYVNGTFAPRYIADFTVGSGTTQASIYNPLCCGCNPVM